MQFEGHVADLAAARAVRHRKPGEFFEGRRAIKYCIFLLAISAQLAYAQSPTDRAVISGIVLDSLRNQPLAGARVSVKALNRVVQTDERGRFVIENVAAGRYDISATHPIADSLGILLEARAVEVPAAGVATVLLALPGESGTRALMCPEGQAENAHGFIRGYVKRAGAAEPAVGARVDLSWLEISMAAGTRPSVTRMEISTVTDDRGYYTFCGLPEDFEGSIQASQGSDASGLITIGLSWKPFGMAMRPLVLPANRSITTAFAIAGRVVDSAGRGLPGATVEIVGSRKTAVSRNDGSFRIVEAPSGTQMLRARKIGYSSRVLESDILSSQPDPITITLDTSLPQLIEVVVRAMRSDVAARSGFDKRALAGAGRYVTAKDLEKNRGHCILDGIKLFLPRAASCSLGTLHSSMMRFRGVSTLQGLQPLPSGEATARPATIGGATASSTACLEVFIDDIQEPPGLTGGILLGWLDPREVVGIEYYTAATAPARLRAGRINQCQLLMIWTVQYQGSHH